MTDFVLRCSTPIRMLPNHGTAGNRAIRNTSVRSFLQRCSTTRGSTTSATAPSAEVPCCRVTKHQKLIAKVTASLDHAYEEPLSLLPGEEVVNVDQTGHKEKGRRLWTWCFRADLYTLFRINPSRSSQVLIDTLGEEFDGVLGCDYFSAYRKYMDTFDVRVQFCIAHLIRDVKFLMTLPDRRTQNYGKRLRDAIRVMFEVIHRRDELKPATFARRLAAARDVLMAKATKHVPPAKQAQNMAKRFLERGEAYFEFITTPNVEPTNNIAEQAIRFVVIDRRHLLRRRGARNSQ